MCFRRIIFSTWATPSFLNVRRTPTVYNLTASFPSLKHGEQASNFVLLCYFSFFQQRVSGKYKLDMDVYHREVKPIFLTKFRSAYGTKKFNDMYVFLL